MHRRSAPPVAAWPLALAAKEPSRAAKVEEAIGCCRILVITANSASVRLFCFWWRFTSGSSKRSSGALSATLTFERSLARKIQSHFWREGGCEELWKPIKSYERCPQPFKLQMRCFLYVRDVKLRGAARNPCANPHEHSIPLGQGWSSGGCSALVSCAPNQKFGPLISSLSFPHDCNELLPAQVGRSARRRSTSRLHERARHVWRQGTVHSSL